MAGTNTMNNKLYTVDCYIEYVHDQTKTENGTVFGSIKTRRIFSLVTVSARNKENAVLKAVDFYNDSDNLSFVLGLTNVISSKVLDIASVEIRKE